MPVLPHHRYIGPGNKLDNGEPIDEDDRIAQKHDHAYDKATGYPDIAKADLEAIHEFGSDALQNWNPHSLVGAAGLSIKYLGEKVFGPIYPNKEHMDSARRKALERLHDESGVKNPWSQIGDPKEGSSYMNYDQPSKKMKTENEPQAMEGEMSHDAGNQTTAIQSGSGANVGGLAPTKTPNSGSGHDFYNANASSWAWKRERHLTFTPFDVTDNHWRLLNAPLYDQNFSYLVPSGIVGSGDNRTNYRPGAAGTAITVLPAEVHNYLEPNGYFALDSFSVEFQDVIVKVTTVGGGTQIIYPITMEGCVMPYDIDVSTINTVENNTRYDRLKTFPIDLNGLKYTWHNKSSTDNWVRSEYLWQFTPGPDTANPNRIAQIAFRNFVEVYGRTDSGGGPTNSYLAEPKMMLNYQKGTVGEKMYFRFINLPPQSAGDTTTTYHVSGRIKYTARGRQNYLDPANVTWILTGPTVQRSEKINKYLDLCEKYKILPKLSIEDDDYDRQYMLTQEEYEEWLDRKNNMTVDKMLENRQKRFRIKWEEMAKKELRKITRNIAIKRRDFIENIKRKDEEWKMFTNDDYSVLGKRSRPEKGYDEDFSEDEKHKNCLECGEYTPVNGLSIVDSGRVMCVECSSKTFM